MICAAACKRDPGHVGVCRDGYKRPLVIPREGGKPVPYRRCTTYIDVLESTHNLMRWGQRQVAVGLALRPDLVMQAAVVRDPESEAGKKALDRVVEAAQEAAGASAKATIGTALHNLTEQLDRGEAAVIPESAFADIAAYKAATAAWTMADIEVFVVNDELKVGGTFDRVMELGGIRWIADLKTGRIDYAASKIAMQLAVYANSERYNPETGERTPLGVDRARGFVIHLPAGEGVCTMHSADLRAGWDGVLLAANVWAWRSRKGLLT